MKEFYDYEYEEEMTEKDPSENIDGDLSQYLNDARIPTKATTFKPKKKKQEKIFNIGDKVIYRNKQAVIVFGPYEKNYKQLYEIQTHDGRVVPANSTALREM